jgi:hypothetical protein
MIKLARVQLAAFTNLSDAYRRDFQSFLEETRYFPDLMRLADTLDIVCDQSPFFFKDYYL